MSATPPEPRPSPAATELDRSSVIAGRAAGRPQFLILLLSMFHPTDLVHLRLDLLGCRVGLNPLQQPFKPTEQLSLSQA